MEAAQTKPSKAAIAAVNICFLVVMGLAIWGIWTGLDAMREWHRAGIVSAKQDCITRGGLVTEQFGGFGGDSQWQCEHPTKF